MIRRFFVPLALALLAGLALKWPPDIVPYLEIREM